MSHPIPSHDYGEPTYPEEPTDYTEDSESS
jgi:hypothetical protein